MIHDLSEKNYNNQQSKGGNYLNIELRNVGKTGMNLLSNQVSTEKKIEKYEENPQKIEQLEYMSVQLWFQQ